MVYRSTVFLSMKCNLSNCWTKFADGRKLVHVTGDQWVRSEYSLVYNEYPYRVYWCHYDGKIKVFFVSGADIPKACRTGIARLPIRRIERHLWAARMAIKFSKEQIANCIAQLRALQQKAGE